MSFVRWSELDRTTFPEFRDRLLAAEAAGQASEPRSYPGYPCEKLDRPRARALVALDKALVRRRSVRAMRGVPKRRDLSRILLYGHGAQGEGRGPVPSAGGLQGLEVFVVVMAEGWLPLGAYHYDRAGHHLARVGEASDWRGRVPSLEHVAGAALLWVIVGDAARVREKYGERGDRFLMLEAGHLMQNLALLSTSVGCATVPLGGFLEGEIAGELRLLATDLVLYVGAVGVVG